jgi:hypothetical protein
MSYYVSFTLERAHESFYFTTGPGGGQLSLGSTTHKHRYLMLEHPHTGEIHTVNIHEQYEMHQALVWMMMVERRSKDQYKTMLQEAKSYSTEIKYSRTQHQDTPTASNSYCITIMRYTLVTTTRTLNCHTKQNVQQQICIKEDHFWTKKYKGLVMHHLYTLQDIKRLQYFMGHISCNNGNGQMMRIGIKSAQLEVCTYALFIFLPHAQYGKALINITRIRKMWAYLGIFNDMITMSNI